MAPASLAPLVFRRSEGGERQEIVLLETDVAGYRYYDGPALEPALQEGQGLVLTREPTNEHDAHAIAIHTAAGRKLGYVPRRENAIPATMMDQGITLSGRIIAVRKVAPTCERVRVDVRMG